MTKRSLSILIFSFLLLIETSLCNSIWAEIDRRVKGFETYSLSINLGNPQISTKLAISFDHSDIILWEDQRLKSSTWSDDLGGSDLIEIHGKFFRVPVFLDLHREVSLRGTYCPECKGIIGMGKHSIVWTIWKDISFSRTRVTFGGVNRKFEDGSDSSLFMTQCEDSEISEVSSSSSSSPSLSSGLCSVRVDLEVLKRVFRNISMIINPTSQDIVLPPDIFDLLTSGMNIYNQDYKKWPEISFIFKEGIKELNLLKDHFPGESDHGHKFDDNLKITVSPDKFVRELDGGKKRMILRRGDPSGKVITLGTESLKNLVIHKNRYGFMTVQNFITFDTISTTNLILFAIQIVLWLRWKVLNLDLMSRLKKSEKITLINVLTRLLGIAITITSVALPSNREILSENPPLFYGTIALVVFSLLLELPSLFMTQIFFRFDIKKYLSYFEYNLINSFSHEVLILTGLWVLLLQERTEGTSGPFLLILNVLLLYSVSSYLIITTHYVIEEYIKVYIPAWRLFEDKTLFKLKRNYTLSKKFLLVSTFIILIYVYQVIVTLEIFIEPTILEMLNFSERLKKAFLAGFYIVVFVIAAFVNNLLLSANLRDSEKEKV